MPTTVTKRAVIRRIANGTYAYVFEPQPYNTSDGEVADTGNTPSQAHNEVGALSISNAPPNGVLSRAIYEYTWTVPDVP